MPCRASLAVLSYHSRFMGTNPVPPQPEDPVQRPAAPVQQPAPPPTPSDAETHFTNLLSYFKHLVWLTGGALTVVFGVAGVLLVSNLRDARQDAKEQATRVATDEAKTAVKNAFDEKHINDLILEAAKEKVGTVTDKMIEEQLSTKLRPVEDRILLIGHISECEAQMHTGLRVGLEELNRIVKTTRDPQALEFAKSTLTSLGEQYDAVLMSDMKTLGIKPVDFMSVRIIRDGKQTPPTLHSAVQLINDSQDLNAVGVAFLAFRELTGEHVRTFDVAAVKSWCDKHQPQCQ